MRRLLLLALAALAAVPAAASAQTPPSLDDLLTEADLPEIPAGPPQQPEQRRATFKVSLYGVQRFKRQSTEHPAPGEGPLCFDSKGTSESATVARFATSRPARVTLSRLGLGVVAFAWRGADDPPLAVKATFDHTGKVDGQSFDCIDGLEWKPSSAPPARNCAATLTNLGFGLSMRKGRLEASGSESLIVPIGDPFAGCPWGDQSKALYGATQRIDTQALLRSEETEVVLRWRDVDVEDTGKVRSTTRRQTTIYVTFKRVP